MFDARLRSVIDPPLNAAGRWLAARGAAANGVTWVGFALGLGAAAAVLGQAYGLAVLLLLANRLADGLDGAVARVRGKTDLGGFLDIVLDFVVYAALPLAFAVLDPAANALAAAALLASYLANAAAFFGFAALAARRGLETRAQGEKSLYYLAGLAEGFETIVAMTAMCLFPSAFAAIAYGFAALVALSATARVLLAHRLLR